METRSQTRAKEDQSSSSPVSSLEGPGPRPSSRASELEGDLGLTSLLGGGEVLVVGRSRTPESAISGSCDVTLVAAQVPVKEPVSVSSYIQTTADNSDPILAVTDTTTLPGSCAQTPTRSTQIPTHKICRAKTH